MSASKKSAARVGAAGGGPSFPGAPDAGRTGGSRNPGATVAHQRGALAGPSNRDGGSRDAAAVAQPSDPATDRGLRALLQCSLGALARKRAREKANRERNEAEVAIDRWQP